MELLREKSLHEYLEVLASGAPAPGGGSAAALSGAQGAALGAMVTELSIGKKKYLEHTDALASVRDALNVLRLELLTDVDRDTQAYDAVSTAMKLPKETPEEIAHRQAEIQQALLGATKSPLSVLEKCKAALEQIDGLIGKSNTNAASDLGTGAAMLRAGAQGAWLNVLINLSSLKDVAQGKALLEQAEGLFGDAVALADAVFAKIEAECMPKGQ